MREIGSVFFAYATLHYRQSKLEMGLSITQWLLKQLHQEISRHGRGAFSQPESLSLYGALPREDEVKANM
ncbi:hypothetical protein TNCV_3774491 [Trichonephila clavipes]|nr:hypothetical protein TNCV_3774491 [Trichonephila clavipes]